MTPIALGTRKEISVSLLSLLSLEQKNNLCKTLSDATISKICPEYSIRKLKKKSSTYGSVFNEFQDPKT